MRNGYLCEATYGGGGGGNNNRAGWEANYHTGYRVHAATAMTIRFFLHASLAAAPADADAEEHLCAALCRTRTR